MTTTPAARRALLLGNSAGIGLALTHRLLAAGWQVASLSRSPCPADGLLEHVVADVTATDFAGTLADLQDRRGPFDACVYLIGTANDFDPRTFAGEVDLLHANLLSAVATMAVVVPPMVRAGGGHFVGVSSLADELLVADCPGYTASKAGLSSYLTGCAPALRRHGVAVTNVRFGFVDTKMAQATVRPLMVPPARRGAARAVPATSADPAELAEVDGAAGARRPLAAAPRRLVRPRVNCSGNRRRRSGRPRRVPAARGNRAHRVS